MRKRTRHNRINKKKTSYKRHSIKRKRGGEPRTEKYSDEDMAYLIQYIKTLPEGEKKTWIEANIHRMPYEKNYIFVFPITGEIAPKYKKYMQGIDRISAYFKYGDDW